LESVGINWDSRLSGGEKQKLAIIRAIIKKPKLLIMDEVTIGLDDISKRAVYKVIKNEIIKKNLQNGKNSIIIYTDHNPTDDFADYVLTVDERQQLQYSDLLIGEHSHLL
jgi:ABC-type multidrug transport system ATPase subunit